MSLQTRQLHKVDYIPLESIRRPIAPVLDPAKIDAMAQTLGGTPTESSTCQLEDITAGELPPIDVFVASHKGEKMYFAFGGCHRFQAYERAGKPLVKCKLLPCTKETLRVYLGSSVDRLFQ